MARRRRAEKRTVLPDPKFGEILVTKFQNVMMYDGKKSVAEHILYGVLEKIQKYSKGGNALDIFKDAIENVRPHLEVRSRRVGGATYQVPVEVRKERGVALAMRWIIAAARARGENTMEDRLAAEIQAAANQTGAAVKKREDTHRMAEANRAFSHFKW
ncbi:MAG: 30S ribosomal protein S7 [Alphaproteobacteria bacterium]|nr:30S ribosomal protein S7 [Alphaproteobacteria bacterium]MCL2504772.1 30S ribosomal protein S7 [Alphaproteobacteria bacterium]